MEAIDLTVDDEPIDLLGSDGESTKPVQHQPSRKTALNSEDVPQHKNKSALHNLCHNASSARRRTAQLSKSSAADTQPVALPAQQEEPARGRLLERGQRLGEGSDAPPRQSNTGMKAIPQQSAASSALGQLPDPWTTLPPLTGTSALPSTSSDARISLSLSAASAVAKQQQQQSAPLQAGSTEPTPVKLKASPQQQAPPTDGALSAVTSSPKRPYHPPRHFPTLHTQRQAPKPATAAGQVVQQRVHDLQQATQRNSASAMEQMAKQVIESQQAAQTPASHTVPPGSTRSVSHLQRPGPRQQVALPKSHQDAGGADTAPAKATSSAGNVLLQLTTAGDPPSSAAPQQPQGRAATAAHEPSPSIRLTAPFSLSASMQHHFGAAQQQAAAAQPPAESRQTGPAQHSLLHTGASTEHLQVLAATQMLKDVLAEAPAQHSLPHRGASSDHRQAPAAPQTFLRGLRADPALAAGTEQTASNAAVQTKPAAATTQGVPAQPPLPQQWAASKYTPSQMSAQTAYAAFFLHMNMCGAPPLKTAIGLVFHPDALQHQLDQQFMGHAYSMCHLIPKAANPGAASPYSQSSKAPNTWRAAVLGLIDWLVEVHHQGIVEGDPGAKQHRALLLCTIGKAGNMQKDSVVTIRGFLMSIGEHLSVQLSFWCRWISENLPKKSETQMAPAAPVPNVASGAHPVSEGPPVSGSRLASGVHQAQAGSKAAAVPARSSASGLSLPLPFRSPLQQPVLTAASVAHPVSGGHPLLRGHPASGGPPASEDHQSQAGPKPGTVPAPFSVPEPFQLSQFSRSPLGQPAAPAAATYPETSPDAKASTPTVAARTLSKLWTNAWESNVGSKQLATVVSRTVGNSLASADSVPEAAVMSCDKVGMVINTNMPEAGGGSTDLSPTGPSASRLAQRAAESQRPTMHPQSAPTTTAPAAPDSLAVRNGLPVNAQQQGSQSLPSSPLPQQPSLGAAASPRSGLLAKGKLSGGVLAAKGCIAGQPAPVEGNADGQASGSAAAPVPGKGTEHVVPARVNAGEQTSGRASAAAAATDQTRALGSANVSARVLTEAPSSALPAEDAKAVGQDKSMDHGATSPTVLTQAVPNAQRRQLWQSDWIRQQTCMAHLKAAKHDTLMWLRPPQKASARRANRQRVNLKLQEEKACSKEALACRVDLHKQKFPAAGVADDPVLAGFEQAILLTDCFEQLMDGSCPGVVLDHFECRAKALREDGADPLAQQAHYEDDALLIKQFYDSLKEAAQLAARPATRQCLSPSVSGEAILPAAAGVKAEASAAAANTAEPKALPQTTQPAGLEVCAGLPLHPSLAPTSATAAAAVAAAAQPTAEQDTDEGAMPVSVEKPSGKQAKAETATQLGQAAAAADKHEEPVGSKPSHADPQQQGQQAATDSKAEARKVKAECSERMRAKKVAAQRAKRAKTAEAVKADSADNGQAKQRAEAGKASAQKARSASVKGNQADKPAARPAELEEVQKPDSVPAESSQPQKPTAGLAQAETMAQERGSAALAETTAKQPAAGHTETATKAQKTDSVHAERNRARRPTAEDIKAGTDAQEPALAQVKNTQAKKPATTEAANKAEAETMDPASAQTSQGHQAVAQAERPEAVGSDASANRDKLRPLSLFSEAAFKTSDANAAGHMLSKTAAVAASTGQQHPAGKATDMAPADPVPGPLSYLPLVSVENNGRSFCMVAESSGRNNQDVKALLAMDQGICVNPAYLATCLPQEREALEAGGLLNNNHAPRHQAALQKASKDKLVVSAAAAAHGKQDRTPVAATLSLGSTEAQVQDAVPASAGAEHKQPKPPAAAAAAATRAQAAAPKPAIVTISTQSLAADVAQQVSEDKGPVDAPLTEGPSSPTAKSPSAAASLVPTSPTAPSALPAPNGPTAPEGPTAPAPAGPIAHPTALGNPPAHATKQSSKKRKQAKQPSKGAGGSAVSQRKRKKPLGSEVAAAGAGSGLAHQEEARTSVSTLDYTVGDPSLGDPGQDGEVASPKDADPDSVRAKLAVPAVKPEWPPLSPTSSSLAARESTAAQHVRSPPARDPPTAADDTHMQTADATHATTHGAHLPQQHGGSPPTKESPTTAEDTHVQAAGPTPGSHPPQQHVGSPPAQDPPTTADDTHMQAPDPTPRAHPPHQQSSLQADDRSRQSEPDATVERHGSQQRQETAKQRQQQQQPHELPQQQQQDEQELRQQQQQQKELPPQQQQQKQQQQQQQEQAGQSAQPAQSKGSDQAQEQLIAAEAECQQQKDAEEVACTAGNLDSMLLTKQAALAMFAFELQLEEWRASHNRQSYHSLLLGSYILVSGHDHIHLRQVKGFRADANRFPVFITTNEEEVPYDCLSDSQHCCDQQVLLEQKRILDQGKQARLTRLEVADANAAVRLRLCMEYFSVLKQLASKGLSEADRISLQQQLEHTILRTQSRPSQEVLDAVEGDFEGQEKASQVQLDELQQKLRLAADMKASDTPGNRHAQQAQSQGQEATAPSQPAAVIISRKGMNTTPAVAKSSNDTPPELPQAKATPSSPDPQKQADAVMGSLSKPKQTEDKAVSKYPEATDSEPTALLVLAAKDGAPACPLVATPSTAHTPTAPQVAAQSLRQPVTLPADVPAASQGNNETQPAQISGQNMPMSRLAEPQALLVSNQAAAQGASEPMPPLLGVSSVTPLPPPVYSPARAVPTALKPAESPMGPLPSTSVAAEPARTVPTALKPTESPVGLLPSTSVAAEPAGSAVEAGTAKDDHHDTAMADVGAPGEEEASGVEAAQGTAVALASQEATARMMMWQVYQPSQGLVDLISGGMVHSALLTHTAAWGSAPAVLNVTIESHGTWGFVEWASVECVKALAKSQAEGSCPWTHLGGIPYWLILSTPNVPVPAYACSAAAAASMSVLTADQKPKYNHATDSHQTDQPAVVQSGAVPVAGAVQSAALHPEGVATSYQYPSYGHGYGYAQGYGYTGWPAVPAWQPVHQWPFTLQAPLGHHQPVPPPQPPPLSAPPPSSPALPANQTSAPPQTTPEPIRQLVPLAPQPPQPEAPDPVQAPEIALQTITSFVSDTGLRSKPLGLSGKRPAPAADAASKGKFPVKKHASEVKGKPSGTKASGLMTALDKPSSKADLATQEHPQNPSKTSPGPPKKLFAFALNPQAQSRRRTAAAGPSSSSPSSTLHPATATTPPATAATPPATAATAKPLPQNAPVVEESASDHLTDLPSRSSRRRLSSAKGLGLRAVPSAAPSAKPVDGSLPSNAVTAALSSEMQGASTRVVVPMTRLYASPQVHPNPAPGMAPTIPQADQPCSLAASQSWAKSGSLPLKFRFDMAEPAVTSGSNLADAGGQNHGLGTTSGLNLAGAVHHDGRVGITSGSNLADAANLATGVNITSAEAPPTVHEGIPLLPDSATAEEEAAQQEKEELPPLPPSPGAVSGSPRLPDGSPALLGKSVKPTLRMVTASEQLPPLPLSPPQQKSRRSSSSSMGSRWGKPQPDPTTTTTDGTQKAVAETATAMSHHTAAVQLPEQLHEQLPVTPMDESSRSVHRPFTRWDAPAGLPGPPPLPHPPGGTLQSAPPSYGIPTDPRLARRGRPQSALRPTPTPEGSSMVAPSNPHNPSTTGLHRPSAHAPKLPREPPQHTPQHPPQQQSQQHPPQHPPQQHPPQQPPQITQAGSGSWYVANPDACDRCRSSSMALRYRWGRGSAVEDSLEVTACLWSTKRMGRCLAQRGYKAELFELLFPLHLKFEDLGRRHTLSSDRQRGDWYRDLRHRWDGSLVVFTAQHATQHATMIGLARLCSLLRESKQPLLSVEGALGPARLWLTSSLGILQTVMDYMSEGALASLKQVVPGVGSADASNTQKLSFVVGLVLLND